MNARQRHTPLPGPDLLVRYLNAYLHARHLSEMERPWGVGDGELDAICDRLSEVAAGDARRINRVIVDELSDADRQLLAQSLAPLIFAMPLREYPAELRATREDDRLVLYLRHVARTPAESAHVPGGVGNPDAEHTHGKAKSRKDRDAETENVGHLPAGLTAPLLDYLRRVLRWPENKKRTSVVTISSGGRRRRVRVTLLVRDRGMVVRFLERLPSPADEM